MKYRYNEISDIRWFDKQKLDKISKTISTRKIIELGRCPLITDYGNWTYIVFGDYVTGAEHDVLIYGNFKKNDKAKENVLMRMHSSCRSSELFHASNCECRQELEKAMREIAKEKNGILLYLNQEGAGNGIVGKMRAYNNLFEWKSGKITERINKKTGKTVDVYDAYAMERMQPDSRDYSIAGEILKQLGVESVRLMTNNPRKINGLESIGIRVARKSIHIKPENEIIKKLLKTKANKLGHKIGKKHLSTK